MTMMRITIRHGNKYYMAVVSRKWVEKHDNGAVVSCGLSVGEPDSTVSEGSLAALIRMGKAKEISQERYNHSGCQSGCVLRGDKECRW
jgi:hypothetical protein